jgi:fumarate reductase subunit D
LGIGLWYFFKYLGIGLWKLFSIGGRVIGMLVLFVLILGLMAVLGVRFGDITFLHQSFQLLAPQWMGW